MIASLKGKILIKRKGEVVIEVGGVGYRVLVPERLVSSLGSKGSEAFLVTYLNVREDAQLLFGFQTWEEREVFAILIGVSGIGPKTALGILSDLTLDELVQALMTENVNLLTSVNGIGKKTAQRLIVELKDKLSLTSESSWLEAGGSGVQPSLPGNKLQEAIEALVALGYPQLTAARSGQAALRELSEDAAVSDLIKAALKHCTNVEVG